MPLNSRQSFSVYLLSVIIAMMLRIAPWPDFAKYFNPDWILLVLIYWSLALPERVGIFNAWFVGLLTDVLTGRLLGQHAIAYVIVVFLCIKLHRRLRRFPMFQQAMFVLAALLISQSMLFWTDKIRNPLRYETAFWLPVLTGTLCWSSVYGILRKIRFPDDTD
ncbi:MAG: rod shape-determining protein MreD [Gammaproteobacteria bacterium]